ncbi:MAG: hypothetical protein ACREK1_12840, partial [Longimicrobiales bacterium]
MRAFHRRATISLLTVLVACSSGRDNQPFDPLQFQERTGVIFVAQNVVPGAVMEALFEGRVVADSAGCLRLDSPDPATVVWPKGFTISESGGALRVRNDVGREIGQIGGSFRLGGGEVQSLQEGVSAADRQRAQTNCPGRYW